MSKVAQLSTAQALKSALAVQEVLFTRSISVSHLLGNDSGLFSRKELVEGAKRGADTTFKNQVDALIAAQTTLSSLFATERAQAEKAVDELTLQLLTELGFQPRRSRYAHRRPAWVCTLPCHSWSEQDVSVLSIGTVFVDKKGDVSSLYLRVSEYDNGSSDSWTMERRNGRLAVVDHIDF